MEQLLLIYGEHYRHTVMAKVTKFFCETLLKEFNRSTCSLTRDISLCAAFVDVKESFSSLLKNPVYSQRRRQRGIQTFTVHVLTGQSYFKREYTRDQNNTSQVNVAPGPSGNCVGVFLPYCDMCFITTSVPAEKESIFRTVCTLNRWANKLKGNNAMQRWNNIHLIRCSLSVH